MKYVYIPTTCVRCENEMSYEMRKDCGVAYCKHCNFILKFSTEEMEQISELIED